MVLTCSCCLLVFASCILGLIVIPPVLKLLYSLKLGQKISEDAPDFHSSKAGTPTMGGLIIIIACLGILIIRCFAAYSADAVGDLVPCIAYMLVNALIGAVDDWLTVFPKKGIRGIKSTPKAAIQLVAAVLFVAWIAADNPGKMINFCGLHICGVWYVILMSLAATVFTNFVNITDGLDGLCSGMAAVISIIIGIYFDSALMMCLAGACIAFLYVNSNPAKAFMGDTGSLFIGSALIGYGITTGHEYIILIASAVFILDGLSTVIQWMWFKITRIKTGEGRRIFLKAPVHHHFEMKGVPEQKIVAKACIITFLCSCAAVLIDYLFSCGGAL